MKLKRITFFAGVVVSVALTLWCAAGNQAFGADEENRVGTQIHQSLVEGYQLEYRLVELPGQETPHLMVYIQDPEGGNISQAKVGFLIIGPDESKQKLMAMGMKGAFGADVDLRKKGQYTIKTKAVTDEKTLIDKFFYEAK
ncbi:MAG: hypothetical protein V1689_04375 [Pseudomonadota bacterium]